MKGARRGGEPVLTSCEAEVKAKQSNKQFMERKLHWIAWATKRLLPASLRRTSSPILEAGSAAAAASSSPVRSSSVHTHRKSTSTSICRRLGRALSCNDIGGLSDSHDELSSSHVPVVVPSPAPALPYSAVFLGGSAPSQVLSAAKILSDMMSLGVGGSGRVLVVLHVMENEEEELRTALTLMKKCRDMTGMHLVSFAIAESATLDTSIWPYVIQFDKLQSVFEEDARRGSYTSTGSGACSDSCHGGSGSVDSTEGYGAANTRDEFRQFARWSRSRSVSSCGSYGSGGIETRHIIRSEMVFAEYSCSNAQPPGLVSPSSTAQHDHHHQLQHHQQQHHHHHQHYQHQQHHLGEEWCRPQSQRPEGCPRRSSGGGGGGGSGGGGSDHYADSRFSDSDGGNGGVGGSNGNGGGVDGTHDAMAQAQNKNSRMGAMAGKGAEAAEEEKEGGENAQGEQKEEEKKGKGRSKEPFHGANWAPAGSEPLPAVTSQPGQHYTPAAGLTSSCIGPQNCCMYVSDRQLAILPRRRLWESTLMLNQMKIRLQQKRSTPPQHHFAHIA